MRYPASEKLEIIQLVEESTLPVRRTLEKIGIPHATFYRWYDRYLTDGVEALTDHRSRPDRVWNRIPDRSGPRSSSWRCAKQSSAHASWRCASPTRRDTSSRKRRYIGS